MLRTYADEPLVRKHAPVRSSALANFRPCLRLDFDFCCFYCLSGESEVAPGRSHGGFEIDHFRPVSRFPQFSRTYRNLMWCCHACNRAKSDTWPTEQEVKAGFRFHDPSREGLGIPIELRGVLVQPRGGSTIGAYVIDTLRLNSSVHQRIRNRRNLLRAFVPTCEGLLARHLASRRIVEGPEFVEMRAALDLARSELGDLAPWDAPVTCACSGTAAPLATVA
jgi:HNH endonuclease